MKHEVAVQLVEMLREIGSRVRIKKLGVEPFDWDRPLFSPTRDYLETQKSGPLSLSVIECIDVEKEEQKYRGRLVAPLVVDHAIEIEASLGKLGLAFQRNDTFFRIPNEDA